MNNITKNGNIEITDETTAFIIPEDVRRLDGLLDQVNQTIVGDQGLMCEGAVMYIATALVHSTGDVDKNIARLKDLLDKYVVELRKEHAGCIEHLQESGKQHTVHTH